MQRTALNKNKLTGERIKRLRSHYKLSVLNFAKGCNVSNVTILKAESGGSISERSLVKIASGYGSSLEWLLFGLGEMFPSGPKEIPYEKIDEDRLWKEKTFKEMQHRGKLLEIEIEKLWEILTVVSKGSVMQNNEASFVANKQA